MGTTRIKVIDLSSDQKEIKTARKHAEKILTANRSKEEDQKTPEAEVQTAETPDINPTEETIENQPEPKTETKQTVKKSVSKTNHKNSANYQKAASLIEDKNYTLKEALELLPKTSFTKFDPAVEVHLAVSEKNLKATVNMPHLKAEKKTGEIYLFFGDKKQVKADNVKWGDEKTIAEIEAGTVKPGRDFTILASSPSYMPKLTKIAKILGPKGLMPNPKNGTITEDFEKLLTSSTEPSGTSIKSDPSAPVVHTKIGKLSQKSEELEANFKALVNSIGLSKIKKASLTTTMGPSIKLETTKLIAA